MGITYFVMFDCDLFPQLETDSDSQTAGWCPTTIESSCEKVFNARLPQRWIGRSGTNDSALHHWPPRSPDLNVCSFFLAFLLKGTVYIPPLPTTLVKLKTRIRAIIESNTRDTLAKVWDECVRVSHYRIDIICYASR